MTLFRTAEARDPLTASDGTRLEVSPLRAADKSSLREGVKHLSPESAYRRFFVPTAHLTDGQLTYLTTVDHQRHEALGVSDPATGEGVAVARYIQTTDDPSRQPRLRPLLSVLLEQSERQVRRLLGRGDSNR